LKGSVVVAKVDADQNRKLGHRFGIRGFPTLKLFKGGNFYNYSGDRSIDSLVAFAEGTETLLSLVSIQHSHLLPLVYQ
jgi:thioredoxin-like negative regulator of GroEL